MVHLLNHTKFKRYSEFAISINSFTAKAHVAQFLITHVPRKGLLRKYHSHSNFECVFIKHSLRSKTFFCDYKTKHVLKNEWMKKIKTDTCFRFQQWSEAPSKYDTKQKLFTKIPVKMGPMWHERVRQKSNNNLFIYHSLFEAPLVKNGLNLAEAKDWKFKSNHVIYKVLAMCWKQLRAFNALPISYFICVWDKLLFALFLELESTFVKGHKTQYTFKLLNDLFCCPFCVRYTIFCLSLYHATKTLQIVIDVHSHDQTLLSLNY